jgi:hypothetical protein
MNRLLVVGAGATIEESKRSGNHPTDPTWAFPVISDFCSKLFDPTSEALLKATASYLDQSGVPYDPKLLSLRVGDSFSADDITQGPVGIFLQLEAEVPTKHNIERLCEHVWHRFGRDSAFWATFIHDGIFLKLFAIFSEQFGLGSGRSMEVGRRVASTLAATDVILNLNYDIAFDLALKQVGKLTCYAPEVRPGAILCLKPHGSFNFYVNLSNGNCFFEEPDRIHGSVGIPDPAGGVFFQQHGIVPRRLNKSYDQHPSAQVILDTQRPFLPKFVTFWGVGLTDSDLDLLAVYREAATQAETVEFINPSSVACENAVRLLGVDVQHCPTLEAWFTQGKFRE